MKIALNVCKDYWKSAYVKHNTVDDSYLEQVCEEDNVINYLEKVEERQEEMEEIVDIFNGYSIEYPTQNEIDQCIDNLRVYVPKKKNLLQGFQKLLWRGQIEISYIGL